MPWSVIAWRVDTRGKLTALRGARNAVGEVAQVRGHAAELARGALQLHERHRLVARGSRDRLGPGVIGRGDAGDARHALAEARAFLLLLAGYARDALRVLGAGGRAPDDDVQRAERRLRQRLGIAHDRPPTGHLCGAPTHRGLKPHDDLPGPTRGVGTLLGQLADLIGDDGKPPPALPGARRF